MVRCIGGDEGLKGRGLEKAVEGDGSDCGCLWSADPVVELIWEG